MEDLEKLRQLDYTISAENFGVEPNSEDYKDFLKLFEKTEKSEPEKAVSITSYDEQPEIKKNYNRIPRDHSKPILTVDEKIKAEKEAERKAADEARIRKYEGEDDFYESLNKYIESFSSKEARNYLRSLLLESLAAASLNKEIEKLKQIANTGNEFSENEPYNFETKTQILTDEDIEKAFVVSRELSESEAINPNYNPEKSENGPEKFITKSIEEVKWISGDGNISDLKRPSSKEQNEETIKELKDNAVFLIRTLTTASTDKQVGNSITVIIYEKQGETNVPVRSRENSI